MLKWGDKRKKPERISLFCIILNIFDLPNRVNLNIFMDGYKFFKFQDSKTSCFTKICKCSLSVSRVVKKKTKAQFHLFISGDRRIQKYREM